MRIVSLLPSATEILFALGFDKEIVGVSHECDFPAQARTKRVVIHSRIPHGATPLEIDGLVRDFVSRGESMYAVDGEALEELAPDLIVTQDLCHVCAASPDDLATALARFGRRPEVLCLNPQDLGDVWRDILWVGEETCHGFQAEALVKSIGEKLGAIGIEMRQATERPRVAFLEWLQPFYVGGHWVPEMIELAGARDVFGKARTPSVRVTLENVVDAAPDILVIAPCGYSAEQARDEYRSMAFPDEWNAIPAVRHNRVYALEANSYFSRPGPRLVTGVEILAKLFHPAAEVSPEAAKSILPITQTAKTSRAAAV
ncbi:MAG TPA: cobalamin-binding protein [Candidatus Saccharimonadales bacterium]|jgi:iron complex transport system substrate-binding protein|nr:cobalamin-binding protein [Candidatus Saccharimonadales bacterium]